MWLALCEATGCSPHEIANTWTPEQVVVMVDALIDRNEIQNSPAPNKGESFITADSFVENFRAMEGN